MPIVPVAYRVNCYVGTRKCPWLERPVRRGAIVYLYGGPTYGCIGPTGTAVTIKPNQTPFFELPNAVLTRRQS